MFVIVFVFVSCSCFDVFVTETGKHVRDRVMFVSCSWRVRDFDVIVSKNTKMCHRHD